MTIEQDRLQRDGAAWKRWGPYLSERAWGTVREDYSPYGEAWNYFPHDHARSRAYRWNEDGLAGICDAEQRLCFALTLWNGRDPILKERLFGLTGPEGNHGEDVKEYYFYLDSTPTHSYMKMLYKYPQAEFPYADPRERRIGGAASRSPSTNSSIPARSPRIVTSTCWWSTPRPTPMTSSFASAPPTAAPRPASCTCCPRSGFATHGAGEMESGHACGQMVSRLWSSTRRWGATCLCATARPSCSSPKTTRTSNGLHGAPNPAPYIKDGINEAVVNGRDDAVNPARIGTKAAAHLPPDRRPC